MKSTVARRHGWRGWIDRDPLGRFAAIQGVDRPTAVGEALEQIA
jgi:hypothetical protein